MYPISWTLARGLLIYSDMTTPTTTAEFKNFPLYRLEQARAMIIDSYEKLSRAARRAGQPAPEAPELVVVAERVVVRCTKCGAVGDHVGKICMECGGEDGITYGRPVVDLEFRAGRPCLDGYEFLAVVEPMQGGNLIRTVPGASIATGELDAYRAGDQSHCDHCATRRQRNETFVVRLERDGTRKLVGRDCLSAFLGGKSIAEILARLAIVRYLEQADGEGGGGSDREQPMLATEFLAWTAAAVRLDGFLSRTAARAAEGRTCTADGVTFLMQPPPQHPEGRRAWVEGRARLEPTAADVATAAAVLAWAPTTEDPSDYMQNVRLMCAQTAILGKHAGILASAVSAWERATGVRVRAEREARGQGASAHVGEVKAKITATVTVERVADVETMYGIQHFHSMRDAAGNALLWKTASRRLPVGWHGEISGTVKKHAEFRGEAQTELVRCKGAFPADDVANASV